MILGGMPSDEYMLLLQEVGVAPPDIPRMTRVTPPVRYYTIDANGRQVLQSEGGVPVAVNGQTFQQRFVSHPSTSSAPPQHLNSVMKINPWNGSGKMCPSSSSPLTETANMRNTLPTESRPSRNTVKRIVHLIEEDELEEAKKTPRVDDTIVIYSRGQHGAVSVHFNDMECLKPDQMLNDTIIDFYMKYIQYEMVPAERRSSIYIFSSFFYPRITQMGRNGTGLFPKSLSVRQKLVRFFKLG
ncbi:hypothetical protein AB6A40_009157 [Gnathostoma spinigerum]|uniref:Ubiquitin-like protease family profile domain-containing protein n=1 Tax=Gnathostoma spinigerum TaxID=75299 RepID=A0ABD6ER71_9BILA